MIKDNFYPTASTQSSGGITYAEYTARIGSAVAPADFPPDMYWLGYVAWDDLPACYRISRITRDGGRITCNEIPQNVDIGYMGYSVTQRDTTNIIVRADSGLRTIYDSNFGNNVMFFNSLRASSYGRESITIVFYAYVFNLDQEEDDVAVSLMSKSVTLGFRDAMDFVNGASRVELTNWTVEEGAGFAAADVYVGTESAEMGRRWYIDTNVNDTNIRLCITMLSIRDAAPAAVVDPNGATVSTTWSCPRPVVHFADGSTSAGDIATGITSPLYAGNSLRVKKSDLSVDVWPIINNDVIFYGFNFDFGGDDFTSDDYTIIFSDDMTAAGFGYGQYFYINPILSFDDIIHYMGLQIRWIDTTITGSAYGYTRNKIYAPYITDDNRFTASLITGDLSDPAYMARLRPWQYDVESWKENNYEESERPPYTPGDDDAPQNVGASIVRPSTLGVGGTSGFITQYVLTAAEIATLGRTLWTSFVNPDYWKNFLFSLALDTGSFDMSSLLNYFISLRVYPFSLINVPSYAATGSPSIYVGSGTVPLKITGSASLHTINNFADYLDAGSCSVHSAYFHDDFRDYSNVEIMLYLPYCGTVQLNPGDVVGGTLHAQYAVDFATGGCVAYVDLTSADGASYPIAVLPGSIGADVPLTATNAGQIAARFAGDVINFASTVSTNAASDLNARASAATGAITGGATGALSRSSSGIGAIATGGINAGLQHASQALDMATRPAIGIPTLSGGRGFSSFGAPQTAYIQIRRGIYKRPQTYDHTIGSPSSASKTIGSLAGLVKGAVDTAGLSCTADEAAEVRTIIAAGIII